MTVICQVKQIIHLQYKNNLIIFNVEEEFYNFMELETLINLKIIDVKRIKYTFLVVINSVIGKKGTISSTLLKN